MEPIFLYSLLVVVSSIIFSLMIYDYSKNFFNLGIFFNTFIVIYGVFGINIYWFLYDSNQEILEEVIKVIFISSIAFNLSFRKTRSLVTLKTLNKTPCYFKVKVLFTVVSVFHLFILSTNGILFLDRTSVFSILYQNKYIFLLSSSQIILYIIIL